MFFDGSSSSRKEVNLGGKRKGLAANAKDKASFVEQVSSLRAEREALRRSEISASKLASTWRAYAGRRSLRLNLEQRRHAHMESFIAMPSPASLSTCVTSLNATRRFCSSLYSVHRRRSFVACLSSLASSVANMPDAALQSLYMSQEGLVALQALVHFIKRNANEDKMQNLSHDGATLAEVSSFPAFSVPESKGRFHIYSPSGKILLERRRDLGLLHHALIDQQSAYLLTTLSGISCARVSSGPCVLAVVQLMGSTIVTASWLEWIMSIEPGEFQAPEIVEAVEKLKKEWIQLAVAAQQQQQMQHSADSSTNNFILAALLLGFRSSSSSSSSSASASGPASHPVTHLSNALLSISSCGSIADIAHWCRLLARRREIAVQIFEHFHHLLVSTSPARFPTSPSSTPCHHSSHRISIARLMRLLSPHALNHNDLVLPLSDLHSMEGPPVPFDAFVAETPSLPADAKPHDIFSSLRPNGPAVPHASTQAIVKELLGCLHDVLLPSSSPSPTSPSSSSLSPTSSSSSHPINCQAVVDICSLLFTLISRSRNPAIPLIFIIHGQHLLPPLFSLLCTPVSKQGNSGVCGAGLLDSCKQLDPLLPHPAWFPVLWVTVVIMNERMDSDDDQDIADGHFLPPAALITLLSACRGVLSRLFFLNPPVVAPSSSSIMLADLSHESSGLRSFALNDWTCGEQHWFGICAHLRDVMCTMMCKAYHRYKSSPAWVSSFGFSDSVFEVDARHSSAISAGLHVALERDLASEPLAWLSCDVADDFIQAKLKFDAFEPCLDDTRHSDTDLANWRTTGFRTPDPSFHAHATPKSCGSSIGRAIITRAPFLLPFALRAELFQDMCRALPDSEDDEHHFFQMRRLSIYRSRLFDMGLQAVSEHARALRQGFQIRFLSDDDVAEDGVDGGGLFKEFLTLLLRELMNMDRGYFTETAAHQLWPHPQAIQFHGSDIFRNIGRVLGMALHHNVLVEHSFATFFLQAILNRRTTVQDLPSLSAELASSLQKLKKFDNEQLASLDMTFEIDDDSGGLGVVNTVDLLRGSGGGGALRRVLTRGDVSQYVTYVTKYWMFDRISRHIEHIRLGINDVVPLDFFNMFNSTELQTLLSGSEAAIDVDDWRSHCSYHGFTGADDPILVMFWRIVEEFSPEQRSKLLHYVTSCSRPPLLGFVALNPGFQIQRMHFRGAAADANSFLPMAATCMNILKLPAYTDIDTMRTKLEYAMNSNSGFFLA